MLQKQAEYEEQIEIMLQKVSQLEKAKSRLQSEVEVLIVDLEKAQNTIAILERAKEQLEKTVNELKVWLNAFSRIMHFNNFITLAKLLCENSSVLRYLTDLNWIVEWAFICHHFSLSNFIKKTFSERIIWMWY